MTAHPLIRYHGEKWRIAPWIISFFPPHRVYVELFGGGGSVLLRKGRSHEEIYNDLDGDIVNLFRVARDRGEELRRKTALTPFAREEYALSYQPSDDPVERARRTLVRAYMGRSSGGATGEANKNGKLPTGFRACSDRSGKTAARVWAGYSDALEAVTERLRGVVIENRDALEAIEQYDRPHTLFYADPPYPLSTRCRGSAAATRRAERWGAGYRFEMGDGDHTRLAEKLNAAKGAVIVSGYDCPLYRELYKGWNRAICKEYSNEQTERTEVLWMKGVEADLFNGLGGENYVKS